MRREHMPLLRSPRTGSALTLKNPVSVADRVREGLLVDDAGNEFPIIGFIPRFVHSDGYCKSFSVEWERWPEILSSYSGYGERFAKETKWGNDLHGRVVLEAGCGSGAFTPHALATGATVVSFDYSGSVAVNYEKSGANPNVLVVQASIFEMPFADAVFDKVFCFGVLQHTPDPRGGFRALIEKLKPGGHLAADIYLEPPEWARLERAKYFWRKRLAGKFELERLHRYIERYVGIAWPIVRLLEWFPLTRRVNRWFLFDNYKPRLPGMDPKRYKEFAALDIFDFISPTYDAPETVEGFRAWFDEAGLIGVDVHQGYNGIEGRGRKLPRPALHLPYDAPRESAA